MATSSAHARSKVSGPATALIISCWVSIGVLLLGLVFSILLLLGGTAGAMRQPPGMSKETQISVRIGWNLVMQLTHAVILLGAMRMKNLRSRGLAKTACILALIPCVGPCFVLGIPFGIWGLTVLHDPRVLGSFKS